MPDSRISDLPAAAALADTDLAPVVQPSGAASETRRSTMLQLRAAMQAERVFHVRDYGAVGNGTTNDRAAVQAAIDAADEAGGGTVMLGPKRYLIDGGDLIIDPGVFLIGKPAQVGYPIGGDPAAVRHALILNAARSVRVRRGGGLDGIALLRQGLTLPTTLRGGLDTAAAFAGNAVVIGDGSGSGTLTNGADTRLSNLLILGFAWGIRSDGNARVRIENILGDCTNGIALTRSYDAARISEVNWQPLMTMAKSWSATRIAIAAVANNGGGLFRITCASAHSLLTGDLVNISEVRSSGAPGTYGRWTVTVVSATSFDLQGSAFAAGWTSGGAVYIKPNRRLGTGYFVTDCDMASFENCFEFGHDIGFDVGDQANSCHFINCGADGWADAADPTTIAVRISGSALRDKFIGGFFAAKGCIAQIANTGTEQHVFSAANMTAGARRTVEVLDGQVTFIGCDFTGATGTANVTASSFWLNDAAENVSLLGCDLRSLTFQGENANALTKLQLVGNRGTTPGNVARVAGGTVELQSVSAAGTPERRVSVLADGTTNLHRRSASLGGLLRLHNNTDVPAIAFAQVGSDLEITGDSVNNPNAGVSVGGAAMTGPLTFRLRRLSGTPAANDRLFNLEAAGNNSAAAQVTFARLAGIAETVTSGSEAGAMVIETRSGGTLTERLRVAASGTVTLAGPLVLPADPTTALQAATKQYVDTRAGVASVAGRTGAVTLSVADVSGAVARAGDTMTGPLVLQADPGAALGAATKQYVDAQFTTRLLTTLNLSAATPLTAATHNARLLIANTGTTLSIDWNSTGNGFSCMVMNRLTSDLAISMTNFTGTTPQNPDGFTRLRAGGIATLLAYTPDGGTTKVLHLTGAGAP